MALDVVPGRWRGFAADIMAGVGYVLLGLLSLRPVRMVTEGVPDRVG